MRQVHLFQAGRMCLLQGGCVALCDGVQPGTPKRLLERKVSRNLLFISSKNEGALGLYTSFFKLVLLRRALSECPRLLWAKLQPRQL